MASFTITSGEKSNLPPSSIGDNKFKMENSESKIFTIADFTTQTRPVYVDPEGDAVSKLKIITLGLVDTDLELSNVAVTVNQEIDASDIIAGLFSITDDGTNAASHISEFTFKLSDVGSNQFSAGTGTFTAEITETENLPATVGNGSATIDYGETLVFTRAMFTSLTTPAYADPEGDLADLLKVTSLPEVTTQVTQTGVQTFGIKLDGVPVIVNQIINFSDIDLGLMTYVTDAKNFDGLNTSFTFEIADAGSGIFVG